MTSPVSSLPPAGADPYTPQQIAQLVDANGVKKANLPFLVMFTLGLLGGAYIALGGMFYTLAITDTQMGLGPTRILGGVVFSLGLVMVVIGGAELFTGNTMLTMAWAGRRVSTAKLLKNWLVIYTSNFVGSLGIAALVYYSGALSMGHDALMAMAVEIAEKKTALSFEQIFLRGILCNVLVCMGVWLALAARDIAGKVLAIVFPVSAFVAMGFEHCVANMYLIPIGMMAGAPVTLTAFVNNLIPATLGNIIGGGVFVALVYWVAYIYGAQQKADPKIVWTPQTQGKGFPDREKMVGSTGIEPVTSTMST